MISNEESKGTLNKEYLDYIKKSMEKHKDSALEDCFSADGMPFRIVRSMCI
jgi:hypothetical protein